MRPEYILERWPYGWLLCSSEPSNGVPLEAIQEVSKILEVKGLIDSGIAHHFKVSGKLNVVMCFGYKNELNQWTNKIKESLVSLHPEEAWWRGVDVGTSSAAIFSVLSKHHTQQAREYGQGSTPRDADALGRCARLLDLFPTWKARLDEVGAAYPLTRWSKIIAVWHLLEGADSKQQTKLLNQIYSN